MKIEIIGAGCPNCIRLEENVKKALEKTDKKAEIIKVTDIQDIMSYGIMSVPAAVINGEVKLYGKVNSIEEIKVMLK